MQKHPNKTGENTAMRFPFMDGFLIYSAFQTKSPPLAQNSIE
jgi:hypothetical protein